MIRPGGDILTKKAIDLAKLPAGARILDVGCGSGETVALLTEQYGFMATGVDVSNELIKKGRDQYEGLDLRCMEAEFLEYESKTFDAVLMECGLSVFRLQEDAVFEAYCILKSGGKLIVTDLFRKNEKSSSVMFDGAFVFDELTRMIEDIGFKIEYFEEVENALTNFVAQAIMSHGSLEEYFKSVVPEDDDPSKFCACSALKDPKNLSYFLMIVTKP